jgi:hypothetical protein
VAALRRPTVAADRAARSFTSGPRMAAAPLSTCVRHARQSWSWVPISHWHLKCYGPSGYRFLQDHRPSLTLDQRLASMIVRYPANVRPSANPSGTPAQDFI